MAARADVVVEGVTRRFGSRVAVEDASFEVEAGEVLGLLGPNGAGKTTLLRILSGYLEAHSGRVVVGGVDVRHDPLGCRAQIGYVPEGASLPTEASPRTFLTYCARLRCVARNQRRASVDAALRQTSILADADRPIGSLSRGTRQRVAIGQALIGDPPVLILDEPTTGLDPRQVSETRALINRLGRRHAVLLSSHLLSEVAQLCRRVVVLDQGHVVTVRSVSELSSASSSVRLEVKVSGPTDRAAAVLGALAGVTVVRRAPTVIVEADDPELAARAAASLLAAGISLVEMRRVSGTLEEAYLRLVGG